MSRNILIVEDDVSVLEMIKFALETENYSCFEAKNLLQAEEVLATQEIGLILLDWMLPGLSGIELAKRIKLKKEISQIPIIMLTAKADEDDKLKGFNAGVDDYLTKPFSVRELLARIKAIFRRTKAGDRMEDTGPITIDYEKKQVLAGEYEIRLTATEYRLLSFLHSRKDIVFSRNELLEHVWDYREDIDERTIDVHIRRLRKSLKKFNCQVYVQTVRGFGYRFSTKTS